MSKHHLGTWSDDFAAIAAGFKSADEIEAKPGRSPIFARDEIILREVLNVSGGGRLTGRWLCLLVKRVRPARAGWTYVEFTVTSRGDVEYIEEEDAPAEDED